MMSQTTGEVSLSRESVVSFFSAPLNRHAPNALGAALCASTFMCGPPLYRTNSFLVTASRSSTYKYATRR